MKDLRKNIDIDKLKKNYFETQKKLKQQEDLLLCSPEYAAKFLGVQVKDLKKFNLKAIKQVNEFTGSSYIAYYKHEVEKEDLKQKTNIASNNEHSIFECILEQIVQQVLYEEGIIEEAEPLTLGSYSNFKDFNGKTLSYDHKKDYKHWKKIIKAATMPIAERMILEIEIAEHLPMNTDNHDLNIVINKMFELIKI